MRQQLLDILRLVLGVGIVGIAEESDVLSLGRQLAQEFEPFRSQCRDHKVDAGCVAAGAIVTFLPSKWPDSAKPPRNQVIR